MDTKTYEDYSKFLGVKPNSLGVVARMYEKNTLNFLTDGLYNVYTNNEKKSKFQASNSLVFEWDIETNYIKKVEFADVPVETGEGCGEIEMAFKERYFEKYDIFQIDETRQQCQVLYRPIRKRDDYWVVTVRLIDNNFDSVLDVSGCQPGMTATFKSVAIKNLGSGLITRVIIIKIL